MENSMISFVHYQSTEELSLTGKVSPIFAPEVAILFHPDYQKPKIYIDS